MIERIRAIGWLTIEMAFILIVLCVLLSLLLGDAAGSFVNDVSGNVQQFLQAIPPGALLGVFLIYALYLLVRKRLG